jgi:hypothetical protein
VNVKVRPYRCAAAIVASMSLLGCSASQSISSPSTNPVATVQPSPVSTGSTPATTSLTSSAMPVKPGFAARWATSASDRVVRNGDLFGRGDFIYAVADEAVVALDSKTGATLWRHDFPGGTKMYGSGSTAFLQSDPVFETYQSSNGDITNQRLIRLSSRDGAEVYNVPFEHEVLDVSLSGVLAVSDEKGSGSLRVIDLQTGALGKQVTFDSYKAWGNTLSIRSGPSTLSQVSRNLEPVGSPVTVADHASLYDAVNTGEWVAAVARVDGSTAALHLYDTSGKLVGISNLPGVTDLNGGFSFEAIESDLVVFTNGQGTIAFRLTTDGPQKVWQQDGFLRYYPERGKFAVLIGGKSGETSQLIGLLTGELGNVVSPTSVGLGSGYVGYRVAKAASSVPLDVISVREGHPLGFQVSERSVFIAGGLVTRDETPGGGTTKVTYYARL